MSAENQNYVVGRGRLFFNKFPDGATFVGIGERYFGNTPSLQMTQANTDLKHYSSEQGLKVMDRSVTLQNDTSGTFMTDNIDPDNLAFWFAGTSSVTPQTGAAGVVESFTVSPGLWYQLGVTDLNPMGIAACSAMTAAATVGVAGSATVTLSGQPTGGTDTVTIGGTVITFEASGAVGNQVNLGGNAAGTAQNLLAFVNLHTDTLLVHATGASNVITIHANTPGTAGNSITLTKSGANIAVSGATLAGGSAGTPTALVDPNDWTVDLDAGRFMIDSVGFVAANSVVTVTYTTVNQTVTSVITADSEVYGELRFIADNPVGKNTDYLWPYIKLTASGTYNLKGDAWQEMTFVFEVLKLSTRQRVYAKQRG